MDERKGYRSMIKCPECGTEYEESTAKCPNCGHNANSSQDAESSQAPENSRDAESSEAPESSQSAESSQAPENSQDADNVPAGGNTSKSGRKTGIIIGCAAAAALIAFGGMKIHQENVRRSTYEEAVALLDEERYAEAEELFEKIPNYKETAAFMQIIEDQKTFEAAIALFNEEKYEEAEELFNTIPEYKDTQSYLAVIEEVYAYREAYSLYEEGEYDAALQIIEGITLYEPAQELKEIMESELAYNQYLMELKTYGTAAQTASLRAGELLDAEMAVWYNSMYQKDDTSTDPYTKDENGVFYEDFNSALTAYYLSDAYAEKTAALQDARLQLEALHGNLSNPPEGLESAYGQASQVQAAFDAYADYAENLKGTYAEAAAQALSLNVAFNSQLNSLKDEMPERKVISEKKETQQTLTDKEVILTAIELKQTAEKTAAAAPLSPASDENTAEQNEDIPEEQSGEEGFEAVTEGAETEEFLVEAVSEGFEAVAEYAGFEGGYEEETAPENITEAAESVTEAAESTAEAVESVTETAESTAEAVESVTEAAEITAEAVESVTEAAEDPENVTENAEDAAAGEPESADHVQEDIGLTPAQQITALQESAAQSAELFDTFLTAYAEENEYDASAVLDQIVYIGSEEAPYTVLISRTTPEGVDDVAAMYDAFIQYAEEQNVAAAGSESLTAQKDDIAVLYISQDVSAAETVLAARSYTEGIEIPVIEAPETEAVTEAAEDMTETEDTDAESGLESIGEEAGIPADAEAEAISEAAETDAEEEAVSETAADVSEVTEIESVTEAAEDVAEAETADTESGLESVGEEAGMPAEAETDAEEAVSEAAEAVSEAAEIESVTEAAEDVTEAETADTESGLESVGEEAGIPVEAETDAEEEAVSEAAEAVSEAVEIEYVTEAAEDVIEAETAVESITEAIVAESEALEVLKAELEAQSEALERQSEALQEQSEALEAQSEAVEAESEAVEAVSEAAEAESEAEEAVSEAVEAESEAVEAVSEAAEAESEAGETEVPEDSDEALEEDGGESVMEQAGPDGETSVGADESVTEAESETETEILEVLLPEVDLSTEDEEEPSSEWDRLHSDLEEMLKNTREAAADQTEERVENAGSPEALFGTGSKHEAPKKIKTADFPGQYT